jgi:hypothetical protein
MDAIVAAVQSPCKCLPLFGLSSIAPRAFATARAARAGLIAARGGDCFHHLVELFSVTWILDCVLRTHQLERLALRRGIGL